MDRKSILISFCIPAYNQCDLVKKCIKSIISYSGNDIEIVVSDDNSTDDLFSMVKEFNDSRICYYRNEKNLGHDLNIINAFEHARGKFAFLLRSRDYLISDSIPNLILFLLKNRCVYATATCLDENGEYRYKYTESIINAGDNTLDAHFNLYIHPSGSLYLLSAIDFIELKQFVEKNVDNKLGFLVHSLIRLQLSQKGDFGLIEKPTWIYVYTHRQKDVAVNKSVNKISVYDPSFTRKRFYIELLWAYKILTADKFSYAYEKLYALYLNATTWGFRYNNNNKDLQKHYQYQKKEFSAIKEHKEFFKYAEKCYCEVTSEEKYNNKLKSEILQITKKNLWLGWIRYLVMHLLDNTFLFSRTALFYRKYLKQYF